MTVFFISRTLALLLITTPVLMAQEKKSVKTVAPTPAKADSSYEIPGRTEPLESATIFSRATGIVKERKFDIGDVVKSGEIIAVIDIPEIVQQVEAARATIDETKARARSAHSLADGSAELLEANAVSREESDQRSASAAEMDAAVRVAEAEYAKLTELQNFATVRAPFDGVIAARNFDRGDRVRGDSATAEGWLYKIARLDTLRFVVSATPDLALRLSKENEATIRFNELPGKPFSAKVSRSSRVFDAGAGTMRIELQMENKDLALPVGLTGTANFSLAATKGTFLVPTNTLVIRDGKTGLLVAKNDHVELMEVVAGRNFGPTVEVTSASLSEATAVIINPNAMIRPGDVVEASAIQIAKAK